MPQSKRIRRAKIPSSVRQIFRQHVNAEAHLARLTPGVALQCSARDVARARHSVRVRGIVSDLNSSETSLLPSLSLVLSSLGRDADFPQGLEQQGYK